MVYTDNQCTVYNTVLRWTTIFEVKKFGRLKLLNLLTNVLTFELVNIDPDSELLQMVAECGYVKKL
jgi:hypothetical protein